MKDISVADNRKKIDFEGGHLPEDGLLQLLSFFWNRFM